MTVAAPAGVDIREWPNMIDADEDFYFKPEAGHILISPADETPCEHCDAQPEDFDVALGVDRFERATGMEIRRVEQRWAGLRTFAPDRLFVSGFDPRSRGFFWLAGQGEVLKRRRAKGRNRLTVTSNNHVKKVRW